MIAMCVGCAAAGIAAGQLIDVDEKELRETFVSPFDKDEIISEFVKAFQFRPDLAPTILRAAFMDACRRAEAAGTLAPPPRDLGESSSGFDHCRKARGVDDAMNQVDFVRLNASTDVSRRDLLALGAIAAVKFLHGPADRIVFKWGRLDDEAQAKGSLIARALAPEKKPQSVFVAGASGENQLYHALRAAVPNLDLPEAVALMAMHGVGEYHEDVSGINGRLYHRMSRHKYSLGPHYFQQLLDHEQDFQPPPPPPQPAGEGRRRHAQHHGASGVPPPPDLRQATIEVVHPITGAKLSKRAAATAAEIQSLLKDDEARSIATSMAMDRALWEQHFGTGMAKMLDAHTSDSLKPYIKLEDLKSGGSSVLTADA